jgi:hypothetical protein
LYTQKDFIESRAPGKERKKSENISVNLHPNIFAPPAMATLTGTTERADSHCPLDASGDP